MSLSEEYRVFCLDKIKIIQQNIHFVNVPFLDILVIQRCTYGQGFYESGDYKQDKLLHLHPTQRRCLYVKHLETL